MTVCLIPTKQLTFLVEVGDFQSKNQKPRPTSSQHFANLKKLIVLGFVELNSKMMRDDPNFNWFKQEGSPREVAKIIVWCESFQSVLKEERKGCS